jgi:hypothetical protein
LFSIRQLIYLNSYKISVIKFCFPASVVWSSPVATLRSSFCSLLSLSSPNFVPNFRFAQLPPRRERRRCWISLMIYITTTSVLYLYPSLSKNPIIIKVSESESCAQMVPMKIGIGMRPYHINFNSLLTTLENNDNYY